MLPSASVTGREILARAALATIPKILTLEDRNPHSSTWGCFDRNYWHYRIIDFPSGMAQELVWPLALAWDTRALDNPYHRNEAIREAVEAGIRYAARSCRRDGSCDDYYPFERAAGAAAFSLLACMEAARLIELDDPAVHAFFDRRADFLAKHEESGRLSNHEALIALCLLLAGRREESNERLARALSWQDEEGWFEEYAGCDPGYLTLTISALARIHLLRPSGELERAIERAVRFAGELMHPDGTFGGEYGSRNTLAFFPDGFELVGRWMPEALAINDRFLAALEAGRFACHDDDHLIGHHAWSFFSAYRSFVPREHPIAPRREARRLFSHAGILVDRRKEQELYVGIAKGGVLKLFREGSLCCSDTQVSLLVKRNGSLENAVAHLASNVAAKVDPDSITIEGQLAWAKSTRMTTARLVILRLFMLAFGRFSPNLVRRILQRLLITGRDPAPYRFQRRIFWDGQRWHVRDRLSARSWRSVVRAGIGGHQTSIYVAMSRAHQIGQLTPWIDLTERVAKLEDGESLVIEREL